MSALLKTDEYSILLDTGASGLFMENADTMGLDLSDLNYVFISHGHADHAGGLESLLRENLSVKVLVSPYATSARFHSLRGGEHCISPKWPLDLMEGRTTWIDSTLEIAPGIKV
ncbi:MAG: MBL fold metallo-hydrolase, partial [Bacteroidales bacterium]|nr:MBL fold metallo-hydrolase [Bacteroidales bacterium]